MRWNLAFTIAAALVTLVSAVFDAETGFTFSQYNAAYAIGKSITFRIAVPANVPENASYDSVIQIAAPTDVGWGGLAWGGKMINNPLSVAWQNAQSAVISSRWAPSHSTPQTYTGAQYTVLRTGTRTNGTYWQVTAKCSGCTSFNDVSGRRVILNSRGSNRLAFAYSRARPSQPSSNSSSFPVHEVTNYWAHDFSQGVNSNFDALVTKNM
ncbi:iron reductase domain protein [Patellaria atrata CBS 101060]|uniref:Iron reductase domain protein n=1 Tax=Patellaria atrata CBS 101060 TaxID=1346257 RepID=A0A9P4SE16_9PEZI|nr:iron reductase domain protein [Patellaria atrata CBS 101060]